MLVGRKVSLVIGQRSCN